MLEYEADDAAEKLYGTLYEEYHLVKYGDIKNWFIKFIILVPLAVVGMGFSIYYIFTLLSDLFVMCPKLCKESH